MLKLTFFTVNNRKQSLIVIIFYYVLGCGENLYFSGYYFMLFVVLIWKIDVNEVSYGDFA